jgi:hypothetical protein
VLAIIRGAAMDISPYLRKPLRSLQEVVETLKPVTAPDSALVDAAAAAAEPECALGDPPDPAKT